MSEKIREATIKETLVHKTIFTGIGICVLFIESLLILISSSKKGVFKKEILSINSETGVDFKIIMR